MNIRLATDQDQGKWNKFVLTAAHASFMQSWEWGQMQSNFGLPVWRILAEENTKVVGVALVLQRQVSFGRCWLYVPHGPVFNGDPRVWRLLNDKVSDLGNSKRAIFVRSDPLWKVNDGGDVLLTQGGWKKAEREVQPKNTLMIDLTKSEEDLLSQMHQKTRYNIKLAQRRGVTVSFSRTAEDMEAFLKLTAEVENRGSFRFHPASYYREMVKVLGGKGILECAVARNSGEILAVHVLIKFGEVVTYTHGASSSKQRELMAPHLLQWESIRKSRSEGYQKYDFFGIAEDEAKTNHPWAGITRFKKGFGGTRVGYVGAHDLVLDPTFYAIYNVAHRMRGAIR